MNITKALVVDDSKVAHFTLRKLLMERNIEVDWVGSGEDAIAYMEKQHPDIIFMDVMMPGMDGFETTTAITNRPASVASPIIICSASATDEDRQNATASGAIDFLPKPYTPAEVDKILDRVRALPAPAALPSVASPARAAIAPVPEQPEVMTETQAAVATAHIERIAERAAWAMADKVAREVATEIAQFRAEQVAHALAEQTIHSVAEEAAHKAVQMAVQAARETAKSTAADTAANVARELIQANIGKAARTAAEQVVREISEELIKKHLTRGLMIVREELTKHLEQQLQPAVQDTLTSTLASQEFKQQLLQLVKETALPLAGSFARQAATEVTQEIMRVVESVGKRARLALIVAGGTLLVALGAAVSGFFR
jgi:CheY-like chemotaxis protein